jgi:hypothetical protein
MIVVQDFQDPGRRVRGTGRRRGLLRRQHRPRPRDGPGIRTRRPGRLRDRGRRAAPLPRRFSTPPCAECALCTFPDKAAAAAQFARVLRSGGRLGITDVTAESDRLPPELTALAAQAACIADARPVAAYERLLAAAGLRTVRTERHDEAMLRMIGQIEARLNLLRITAPDRLTAAGLDLDTAPRVLDAAVQQWPTASSAPSSSSPRSPPDHHKVLRNLAGRGRLLRLARGRIAPPRARPPLSRPRHHRTPARPSRESCPSPSTCSGAGSSVPCGPRGTSGLCHIRSQ